MGKSIPDHQACWRLFEWNILEPDKNNIQSIKHFSCYRLLQEKLDQPVTGPPSPRDINNGDTAQNITDHIAKLRKEVVSLKSNLRAAQIER